MHVPFPVTDNLLNDHYNVHDLPALPQEFEVQFTYILEGEYLTIPASDAYATIPTSYEINICLATQVVCFKYCTVPNR